MARIGLTKRITIDLGLGADNPVLIVRRPTKAEHGDFFDGRFLLRNGEKKLGTARVEFVDAILVGCERIEVEGPPGTFVPLTTEHPGWKELIPFDWKASAAMIFEEKIPESDEKK